MGRSAQRRPGRAAEGLARPVRVDARHGRADRRGVGPRLTRKLNTDLIAEHYDDLLRVAGSLKFGHATASLLVGKLSASGRQNALVGFQNLAHAC